MDGLVASCFFLPCKTHSRRIVFNPADPGTCYIVDAEGNVVPEDEDVERENIPHYRCIMLCPAIFAVLFGLSIGFLVFVLIYGFLEYLKRPRTVYGCG